MLCGLIMAGGMGTRFWPLSTEEKPKQFLNLVGEDTMLQATVKRVLPIIPMERIFISTGEKYKKIVMEQLPDLKEENIIVEPEGRNTAPCIALGAMYINKFFKDSTMVVLPSDHLIQDEDRFVGIIAKYNRVIETMKTGIITFGMRPTRAETGYGYIKANVEDKKFNTSTFYMVEKFEEKPNKEKAEEYLKEGTYLWNGGMFLWTTDFIIEAIKKYLPNTYEALKGIEECKEEEINSIINKNYSKTDAISIDYGVLEKEKEIYVVPTQVGWDDVGSWEAIERYREKDTNGNIHIGEINSVEGHNNLIVAAKHKVIIDNLSNIYVVENQGNIVIGKKENINQIRELKSIV